MTSMNSPPSNSHQIRSNRMRTHRDLPVPFDDRRDPESAHAEPLRFQATSVWR